MNDIVLNKKESVERCIKQIRRYYAMCGDTPFETDYRTQDAIAANLQRVCQQCIDLANHTIRVKKLGLPKTSGESFQLLAQNGIIPDSLAVGLQKMIGFRNLLVHEYQNISFLAMVEVVENHLDELVDFTDFIMKEFYAEDG